MAIAFRATATAPTVFGTTLVINKPTGTVQNDGMVAYIYVNQANASITPPSGWTHQQEANFAFGLGYVHGYTKLAGASEPSTYTWTTAGSNSWNGGIKSYSGVNTTTLVDVSAQNTGGSDTSPVASSVTTTTANTMLSCGYAGWSTVQTVTPAGSMTERFDVNSIKTLEACDESIAAIGATGTRTATIGTASFWGAISIALNEAAAGGATGKSNPLYGPLGGPLVGSIG